MLARQPARIIPAHILASGRPAQAQDSLSSPLERNPQSSKGWKKREADGVGLAIVAALEKPGPVACRASKIAVIEQKLAPVAVKPGDTGGDFPVADFLSSCYLCRKKLHGRDIYMYRGEKAFCSMECRYQQIVSDECMEKCSTGILIRQSEIESAPCTGDRRLLFSTGITAL